MSSNKNKWFKKDIQFSDEEDEDEEEEEVEEEYEEEEEEEEEPKKNKFKLQDSDEEEEEEDEGELTLEKILDKKIPITGQEKLFFEVLESTEIIFEAIKPENDDWKTANEEIGNLIKIEEKYEKNSNESLKRFIFCIAKLHETSKKVIEEKKKLSPSQSKAVGNLENKMRKITKKYESHIEKIGENEKEYEVLVEKEKEEIFKRIKSKESKIKTKEESKTSTTSSSASTVIGPTPRIPGVPFRSRFLLKPGEVESSSDEENDLSESDDEEKRNKQQTAGKNRRGKGGEKKTIVEKKKELESDSDDEELNDYLIEEKIKEMIKKRGTKSTSSSLQYEKLKSYLLKSESNKTKIQVYMQMLTTQFDINPNFLPYTPIEIWNEAYENVIKLMNIINENNIQIIETSLLENTIDSLENTTEKNELKIKIHGNLYAIVERLDDEFIRSLQHIDPHTQDYVERLKDEVSLLKVTELIYDYYKNQKEYLKATRISTRLLDHYYYRIDKELNRELLKNIYLYGDDREKTRAMLEEIYFLANHNKFYESKELLLMSKLQDTIYRTDVSTQILYNRTITQIGLCAFRLGLYSHCYQSLSELISSQRAKELLAQGITIRHHQQIQNDKSKKLEKEQKEERNRLVPYHMHINLDMIECVHLLSAMLLEVPTMMKSTEKKLTSKSSLSKPFRRLLDFYDRQIFNGPPENTKDHINLSTRYLMKGNWKESFKVILKLNVWNHIQDAENTLNLLKENLKIVSMKTWLFSNSNCYKNITIQKLKEMFEIENEIEIKNILKQMILKENFNALLSSNDDLIEFQSFNQSNQSLSLNSLKLLERSNQLNEINLFSIELDSKSKLRNKLKK